MAVDGDSWRDVTLGEGMTPTVQLEPGMYVKVDYMMPRSPLRTAVPQRSWST